MRFLGNIEAKTDAKGRAFLPASFRKVLQASGDESMVLRKDEYQPCLVLYPLSVWNQKTDELRTRLNLWDPRHRQIFRQFTAFAMELTLDGNGRFLLPKNYMKQANIEQDIRFIGFDDKIEIWSASEDPFMKPEEFGAELAKLMGEPLF
jgi:MraZ protein